jgi:hypothetical protein
MIAVWHLLVSWDAGCSLATNRIASVASYRIVLYRIAAFRLRSYLCSYHISLYHHVLLSLPHHAASDVHEIGIT